MLSYLKEGQNIPAADDTAQAGDPDAPVSQQQDFLTVSGHTQRLRQSTMLLVLMFGVGALGVWFMIRTTTPAPVEAAGEDNHAQIEAAIAQFRGEQEQINTQVDSVFNRFSQISGVGQVSVDDLQKNPFRREMASDRSDLEQRLQSQVHSAARNLQLWSITATPRGLCCMIDDKVLYVGDEINGLTVSEIGTDFVRLQRDGVSTLLKMDE